MNQPDTTWGGISDDEDDLDVREPWMWGGKNAYIFLIDATEPMFEKQLDDSSYFGMCIEAYKRIMIQSIFNQMKDLFGIVLYGTKYCSQAAQPKYITTLQDLAPCSADKVKEVISILEDIEGFEIKHGHSKNFSLADALWHCHKMVSNCTTKLSEKKVFLLTCNDNPHLSDPKLQHATRTRVQDLCGVDIHLEIIPFGITFDPLLFFKEIYLISHNDLCTSDIKVVSDVEDIVADFNKSPNKRSAVRVLWSLGDGVKLGVAGYRFVLSVTPFPKKVKVERSKNALVKTHIQNFDTNTGEEVSRAEISKAVTFGGKTITFEPEELTKAKDLCKRSLILLGFKPVHSLQLWFYTKEPYFLYPEEKLVRGSRTLFAALHERCLARKVVALCYFTPRKNAKPALVALRPLEEKLQKKTNVQLMPPGFLLSYLPYADNVRDLSNLEVKCDFPEPDMVTIAENIIDKVRTNYKPSSINNPKLQKHWAGIEALALGYENPEETFDNSIPDYETIDERLGDLASTFMSMAFPEGFDELNVKKASKRTAPPRASAPKIPKLDLENMSMDEIGRQGLVEKLLVEKLREYLQSQGISITKLKKPELVKAVYGHLGINSRR